MALINIVLLTYNRPFFLKKAVNSIISQTFTKFNLIILDNGSDSKTKKVLKSFHDNRITIIHNEFNSLEFINKAFSFLDSKYLMITHDDDEMDSNLLKIQINELELKNNIDLLACRINLIDENSNKLRKIRPRIFKDKLWSKGEYIKQYFFSGNIIPCPTIIFRTDFLKKYPLNYNWEVGPASDLYLLFEANINGVLALSKNPLFNYRIHPNQDSELNRLSMEFEVKSGIIDLLKKNQMINLVSSYNSASNGIILNILLEGFLRKKISYITFKQHIKSLVKEHKLKINKYTVYWSLIGVFRGIKNYYS